MRLFTILILLLSFQQYAKESQLRKVCDVNISDIRLEIDRLAKVNIGLAQVTRLALIGSVNKYDEDILGCDTFEKQIKKIENVIYNKSL